MAKRPKMSTRNPFPAHKQEMAESQQYKDFDRDPLGINHDEPEPMTIKQLHRKLEGTIGVVDVDKLRKEMFGDLPRVEVEVRLDPTKIKAKKRR